MTLLKKKTAVYIQQKLGAIIGTPSGNPQNTRVLNPRLYSSLYQPLTIWQPECSRCQSPRAINGINNIAKVPCRREGEPGIRSGLGFGVKGSGFGVQGSELEVWGVRLASG